MKVSYSWLKDYVSVKLSPKALADRLTMAGLEVAAQEVINKDVVFEIEITANRPDCLSVLGIAQEVAAISNSKLKIKAPKPKKNPATKLSLKSNFISIQDKKGCPYYRGCLITDVKIGPSPTWLRNRIESLGIRSVNNVVDITNYCLLEYGQPLHAFDYEKIIDRIIVRRAKKSEKILTIDGEEKTLSENILVISDKNKAIAIGGIMGDKLSEVDSSTKHILLESAYFDPILVRRGSRELGLSSESSYRFERQVDFDRVKISQDRAIELICEVAGGKFVDEKESGTKIKYKVQKIKFDCLKAKKILAFEVSADKAKNIFSSLGFSCKSSGKTQVLVSVPRLRRDIKIEEDLIEEIARIYGYSKVPSTLPAIRSAAIQNLATEAIKEPARGVLCALGFNEVINYSLISKDMIEATGTGSEYARLVNPLSSGQECLRPMLVAGLLNCLAYNLNHKNLDLRLFELGHVFSSDNRETMSLGLIATGKIIDDWQIKKEVDFFAVKGYVQCLIEQLGFGEAKCSSPDNNGVFSKGEAARIICQGREIGELGRIDKRILLNFGIKSISPVFYAEVCVEELCKCEADKKKFSPLVVFPSMIRDLSLIVKNSIGYEEIADIIRQEAGGYLREINLVDIYKGEQIARGCIGLTISLELGLNDRTLTDEEATEIQQAMTRRLKSELGISIR
ncbi:phenylalanine--tRNA ligase subunit beta [Candidatus Omnitrophota bacterium]